MRIRLNRAHYPVTVLGPGRRAGIWTQGCGIGCDGCVARDTWAPDPDTEVEIGDVLDWVRSLPVVDGVTISGGEPFDQPDALHELLIRLHEWRAGRPIDLLCYSGRSTRVLRTRYARQLALLDAVIPGRYLKDRNPGGKWRGSANQQLIPLTPLGHERYDAEVDSPAGPARMQVGTDGERIYHIGVPGPGDMERLEAAMAKRGLAYREASWRS